MRSPTSTPANPAPRRSGRRLRAVLPAPAAVLALLALAACDDGGTAPETAVPAQLDADVAAVVAEATQDDVQAMGLAMLGLGRPDGLFGVPGPGGHGPGFGPGGGMAPGDVLERSRSITFYDAAGGVMESYDPLLTDRVEAEWRVEGELERGAWSASVERTRALAVTGLEGEETTRTWNGEGASGVERVRHDDENGDREYTMESAAVIADVVVGVPRSENPWPLSGTITHQVEVTVVNGPNGDVTRQRTVVVTFDGTQYATLTVNGESYEVDLADRQGRRPRRM